MMKVNAFRLWGLRPARGNEHAAEDSETGSGKTGEGDGGTAVPADSRRNDHTSDAEASEEHKPTNSNSVSDGIHQPFPFWGRSQLPLTSVSESGGESGQDFHPRCKLRSSFAFSWWATRSATACCTACCWAA